MRDTSFGQVVRLITKGKFFAYPEEKDPSLWKKFVNEEKSGFAAHHGVKDGALQPHGEESDEEEYQGIGGVRTRENGRTEPTEPVGRRASGNDAVVNSETSSMTRIDEGQREQGADYNHASGVKVDPEKGRDLHIVDWYGPDDEENPQNWSTGMWLFLQKQYFNEC
jgi:DHA1 family multidrug resistance protein-like MFS transporter